MSEGTKNTLKIFGIAVLAVIAVDFAKKSIVPMFKKPAVKA